MKIKADNPYELINGLDLSTIVQFYFLANQLKQIFRQGWLREIPAEKVESVADHSFGVAILALAIITKHNLKLDIEKVITMALVHELGEIYGGDITPYDGERYSNKKQIEAEAVEKLFSGLPELAPIKAVWEEYERRETHEAKFVYQLDKLEMAFQAYIYGKQHAKTLNEFAEDVKKKMENLVLKELLSELGWV